METTTSFPTLREQYAEYFARAAAIYNVSPLVGRLYAYLLLSPGPMSLGELAQAVGAAKSTASVVLRTLERYRLVRRQWIKGDRRDFFTARTDFVTMLRELFDDFFSREIKYLEAANRAARRTLEEAPDEAGWPGEKERADLLERLAQLESFVALWSGWLKELTVSAGPVPPAEIIPIDVEK